MIGTTAAIILAASSAASQAYAAHKQASAAKEAARVQAASADKAQAVQNDYMNRSVDAQNQIMYGGGGGGRPSGPSGDAYWSNSGGGQPISYGYGGGTYGQMPGTGGIQGAYNPYLNSNPATLSALHSFLGIPGASQAQTAVPYGGYGMPMGQIQPRAAGGPVAPGQPYLVGERGPELMMPTQPGVIVPNPQQGGFPRPGARVNPLTMNRLYQLYRGVPTMTGRPGV